MATTKKTTTNTRRRRRLPDHDLFRPINNIPEWAYTLMGEETAFIELPELVTQHLVVQLSHDGPGPFDFQLLNEMATQSIRTVAGTGHLCERHSVNFIAERGFKYVLADVTGPWIVHFQHITEMPYLDNRAGSRIEGDGSEVIWFENSKPTRLDFSMPYSNSGVDILFTSRMRVPMVSSYRPWSGTLIAPPGQVAIEIIMRESWKNDASWSLSVGATEGAPTEAK